MSVPLDISSRREWLETNGIGGFASSTVVGMNTRRYHGLLVAATQPPVGRMVLLSKLEETEIVNGRRFELSCNRYPGVIHPEGHLLLKEFRRDPFPTFVYDVDGAELEKTVFMAYGQNTTVIEYDPDRGESVGSLQNRCRRTIASQQIDDPLPRRRFVVGHQNAQPFRRGQRHGCPFHSIEEGAIFRPRCHRRRDG